MKLTPNGLRLYGVDNDDILNGTFYIPNKVIHITGHAFEKCTNLTRLYIPASLNTIIPRAFDDLRKLKEIVIYTDNKVEYQRIWQLFPPELKPLIIPYGSSLYHLDENDIGDGTSNTPKP